MKNDPELLKIKTKEDEIKDLKHKTENHDYENRFKSLKLDNGHHRKKKKSINKKKVLLIITEQLIGSASTISSSTLPVLNFTAGIVISSSIALLFSAAILITKEYITKLKTRFTKLRDWINVIILLYEKTLKNTIIDKKN